MSRIAPQTRLRAALPCALALLGWMLTAASTAPRVAVAGAPSPTNGRLRLGDIAPAFTLQTIDGESLCLGNCLGEKPTLVVFWSYFCFPCQKEIPEIQQVYQDLGQDQLSVISISLDGPAYEEKLRPFLAKNAITFPTVYDNLTAEFFEVAEKYGVVGTPTSFLLDAQGRVRFMHLGRLDPDTLKGLVRSAREQAFCSEITKPTPQ
ncbi:MAG: TlpA disulfide reductase family protein [Deferrisomatales bacterium]|nr:TlpA disulfide reductase family protein [Deferrisomatales bacterium]